MRSSALALLLLAEQAGAVALGLNGGYKTVPAAVPALAASRSPELPAVYAGLQGMLAALAKTEPARVEPALQVVDDMRPYARLVSEREGPRMVVSLGMLDFVADDDELAYVLAQELDKPASQLKELSEQLAEQGDVLRTVGLERMADSEADVKAVLGRVMSNGWSPHGAYAFMTRARARFGDQAERGGGIWSQRRDTIGLAISYWTRTEGRQSADRLGEGVSRREVLGPLKTGLLDAASARAARARALAAVAAAPVHEGGALYKIAASGDAAGLLQQDEDRFREAY